MYTAATVNKFQPVGWPWKFLLQLLSNLTSILTVFLIIFKLFEYYGNNYNFCYVLNFFFNPVFKIDIKEETLLSTLVLALLRLYVVLVSVVVVDA